MARPWDDFRLVKAIADHGGLTAAATRLGINHSTAFRRLTAIEAALGTRLFERARTGYAATQAGTAMVAAAGAMEETASQFAREVAGRASEPTGQLRVTAPSGLVTDLLMPIFAAFRAHRPGIHLDVVVSDDALNLSRRDADVAVRASNDPSPNLFGRRLATLGWALYGRADRAEADPRRADWVTLSEAVGDGRFLRFVAEHGDPERIALRLNTVTGLCEAVEAGIGIGLLPCLSADARPALRRIGSAEPTFADSLWMLTHPDLRHSVRVRAFMDFVGDAVVALRPMLEGRPLPERRAREPVLSRP
ncbi:LysR family transcriptional regulator [Methylobacterium sp. WL120]|uniref:LysR family transcriptional regulator n=1 Tax=Methylobacterium sp. WL120 TaxID=2603887 RepID=UPI0011C7B35A|nr:LysR family transcriptional regulator [Methylobacterium sp. WL120]TXM64469.1 LysR family transcriptional regulator [Methylobacterium sp. WL120]